MYNETSNTKDFLAISWLHIIIFLVSSLLIIVFFNLQLTLVLLGGGDYIVAEEASIFASDYFNSGLSLAATIPKAADLSVLLFWSVAGGVVYTVISFVGSYFKTAAHELNVLLFYSKPSYGNALVTLLENIYNAIKRTVAFIVFIFTIYFALTSVIPLASSMYYLLLFAHESWSYAFMAVGGWLLLTFTFYALLLSLRLLTNYHRFSNKS